MKISRWLHAATATALLTAFVGCEEQDFENDSAVIETQPNGTYQSDPTAPPVREELQQNSQNNPLGDPNADDTLDVENPIDGGDTLNSPAALDDAQRPANHDEGAPAPAEQSPLDRLGESPTAADEDGVTEDVTEQP